MAIHRLNIFFDSPGRKLEKVGLGIIIGFTFTFIVASLVHFIWPTYNWPKVLGSAFGAGLGTGLYYAIRRQRS